LGSDPYRLFMKSLKEIGFPLMRNFHIILVSSLILEIGRFLILLGGNIKMIRQTVEDKKRTEAKYTGKTLGRQAKGVIRELLKKGVSIDSFLEKYLLDFEKYARAYSQRKENSKTEDMNLRTYVTRFYDLTDEFEEEEVEGHVKRMIQMEFKYKMRREVRYNDYDFHNETPVPSFFYAFNRYPLYVCSG